MYITYILTYMWPILSTDVLRDNLIHIVMSSCYRLFDTAAFIWLLLARCSLPIVGITDSFIV